MLSYWIWLSRRHGLRPESREALLERFGDPRAIWCASDREIEEIVWRDAERSALRDKSLEKTQAILDACARLDAHILTMQDAAYPIRLRNIYDPPCVLYVLGQLPPVDERAAIAVVGTRKATPYGLKMGRQMGYELTRGGGLIVSGLAEGVDSAAAQGALLAGGSCIGVLGTAIDVIYPSWNRKLFEDVCAVGALVSEYPPGAKTQRSNFPQRNRILSGLSVGVVVIEAPEKSGALITASRALEQGRDLFVVPGNADSPNCVGSNALMRDCAKPVTGGIDVLVEYERLYAGVDLSAPQDLAMPQQTEKDAAAEFAGSNTAAPEAGGGFHRLRVPRAARLREETPETETQATASAAAPAVDPSELSEAERAVVAAISAPQTHIDDVIAKSGLTAAEALSALTMLEIEGVVGQEPGKLFTLRRRVDGGAADNNDAQRSTTITR